MRSYAIGDIHGHFDELLAAHERILADRARVGDDAAPVVHVGDLIDRGSDSAAVIDWLMLHQAADPRIIVLKGNHDRMFAMFLDDPRGHDPGLRDDLTWLDPRLGGGTTLRSFGVTEVDGRPLEDIHAEALGCVSPAQRAYMAALPSSFLHGAALFVHAGVRPGVDLHAQTETDLVWIRKGFLDNTQEHGALVVHGHTAIHEATHYGNRLNIDSSVAYGGPLSAVVIEGREAWLLTEDGRVPVARGDGAGTAQAARR